MSISKHYPFINIKAVTVKIWLDETPLSVTIKSRTIARTIVALTTKREHGVIALEMSSWAFRLSAYIHILKRDYGLHIQTLREERSHGWHGRYVLHTPVEIIEVQKD